MRKAGMLMVTALAASLLAGCGSKAAAKTEAVTITVFAAKSLNQVMEELIAEFQKTHENVSVQGSYDSSGTLMVQIEEGAACDVFFSAAVKQMNQLDDTDGLVVEGTRHNVVNNQVCVVTYKESNTKVTGLKDIKKAGSIALADGSVPVGKYTRQAMVNSGISSDITDIIDGHPDFKVLVNNCIPLFLFDVNSKFCQVSDSRKNPYDLFESNFVKNLLDRGSVYFSFESKEFVSVCKNILTCYNLKHGEESKVGKSFNDMRVACENEDLNKAYFNSLSRCKEFISSLYKKM